MSRKITRLTLDHLATIGEELDPPCRACLFWELDPVRRDRVEDPVAVKDGWVSDVLREWGSCGRVALVDDRPVGFALYAPPAYLPGAAAFPTAPASADAVLLSTVYVDPAHRRGGIGRMLVQATAADLIRRGGPLAVEAFGSRGPRAGSCLLPADFLARVGFKTLRPHPITPRMRMDLRSSVRWRDEVEAALERLVDALRPAPKSTRASRGWLR